MYSYGEAWRNDQDWINDQSDLGTPDLWRALYDKKFKIFDCQTFTVTFIIVLFVTRKKKKIG